MDDGDWQAWPRCDGCGGRRQTICPACATAGSDFRLAEYLAPAEDMRDSRSAAISADETVATKFEILLTCPQCHDAFAPKFYRRCATCGHLGPDGIEVRQWRIEPLPDRVVFAIACLLALAAVISFYFWMILAH